MEHRIFIAINFPKSVKEKLYQTKDEYSDLPCRWTKKENLHLTLLFLGYLNDQEILATCQVVRQVAEKHRAFALKLNQIAFGPANKKTPRMVWANGLPSKELSRLQHDLENSLFEKSFYGNEEKHLFFPHVTLARIRQWQFKQMEPEEVPVMDRDISLTIPIESIEVMESRLKRDGPEYDVLESCPLAG